MSTSSTTEESKAAQIRCARRWFKVAKLLEDYTKRCVGLWLVLEARMMRESKIVFMRCLPETLAKKIDATLRRAKTGGHHEEIQGLLRNEKTVDPKE